MMRASVSRISRAPAVSGPVTIGWGASRVGVLLVLSGAHSPDLRREAVLADLAIQRAAADVQHARRLLLVPLDRVEDAGDVRPLGIGERRQLVAPRLLDRLHGVQELDVVCPDRTARG